MKRFGIKVGLALALALSAGTASAVSVTYANTDSNNASGYFGSPDTTNYGEAFSLSTAATLNSLSFYASGGAAPGNLELVIAPFSNSVAGAPVYTSAVTTYSPGGLQAITFSNINTTLAAATTYIAYLTTANITNPVSNVFVELGTGNGTIGSGFYFLNSAGSAPGSSAWTSGLSFAAADANLRFSASFTPAPVPVPAAAWLLLSGLGGLGIFSRRRSVAAIARA